MLVPPPPPPLTMAVEFDTGAPNESVVELTPLIDVIFQLLVFFMLSSSFLYPALDLVLPQLSEDQQETDSPMLVINLDSDGNVFINSEPVTFDNLEEQLRLRLGELQESSVFLRADKGIEYGVILKIMRTAGDAGALQFNFLYEEEAADD
jgi:biopolymer transport protein ExbD